MIVTEQSSHRIVLEFDYLSEAFFCSVLGFIWLIFWHSILKEFFIFELIIAKLFWATGFLLLLLGIYLFTLQKTIIFSRDEQKAFFIKKSIIGLQIREFSLKAISRLSVYRYARKGGYYNYRLYLEIINNSRLKKIYLCTFSNYSELIQQGGAIANLLSVELFWCNPPQPQN